MSASPVSVMVRDSMSALEYHEAAWAAHELETEPPDPSDLSDRALAAILRYETGDMPPEAVRAVKAERKRRVLPWGPADLALGFAILAALAASGVIIGWFLLVN
jgi:hypothetical protein